LEHITGSTRKIQQQTVNDKAGGGDQRKTQNKKTEGRILMKPPKISTHSERQDNQIYENITPTHNEEAEKKRAKKQPEIPARDKNETKGRGDGEREGKR
jgi:hypothetical protein